MWIWRASKGVSTGRVSWGPTGRWRCLVGNGTCGSAVQGYMIWMWETMLRERKPWEWRRKSPVAHVKRKEQQGQGQSSRNTDVQWWAEPDGEERVSSILHLYWEERKMTRSNPLLSLVIESPANTRVVLASRRSLICGMLLARYSLLSRAAEGKQTWTLWIYGVWLPGKCSTSYVTVTEENGDISSPK